MVRDWYTGIEMLSPVASTISSVPSSWLYSTDVKNESLNVPLLAIILLPFSSVTSVHTVPPSVLISHAPSVFTLN